MRAEGGVFQRRLSRRGALGAGLTAGAFLAAVSLGIGCGDDGNSSAKSTVTAGKALQATIVSSELVPGPNRFVFALFDSKNQLVMNVSAHAQFYSLADPNNPKLAAEADAKYYEISVDDAAHSAAKGEVNHAHARGVYVVHQEFSPGQWVLRVLTADGRLTDTGTGFAVGDRPHTPALGAAVPLTISPTYADHKDASELCTRQPECGLHVGTIADAIAAGQPAVIIFATPAYCNSRVCGPVLEVILGVREKVRQGTLGTKDGVNFVHVEIFKNWQSRERRAAVNEWNLQSEPWIFVVDGAGRLTAKFEGIMAGEELEAALREVARA